MSNAKQAIPSNPFQLEILRGIMPIKASQILPDIVAGITLAALAIPEVMGYTKIAGTPVVTGLITLLIPAALFALFGSSRHLVVGADSATAAILAGGLVGIALPGSVEYTAMAALLALMCAGLLALARVVRLGFMADFLSRTVLIGFLTGVGIQVALGSIAGMLGLHEHRHEAVQVLIGDFQQIGHTNLWTLAVSVSVIAVMVGARLISKKIPGALIAVTGATLTCWFFHLQDHGVHVLGAIPHGLPDFGLPAIHWSRALVLKLIPTAMAMFVVILAQSAATSRAYASEYDEPFNENTDLIGLTLANIGAGLSGTFVVNGSPTKTQMVASAGGKTQISCLTMSLIVLMVLLFLTAPLAYMPSAVLSAVVFLIGVELMDIKGMRRILAQRPSEFCVALITTIVVVLVGVEQGILLAMTLSLMEHVRRSYRSKNTVMAPDATGAWHLLPVNTPQQVRPGLLIYRFSHTMYYANAQQLYEEVTDLTRNAEPPLTEFCIDASAIASIDFTAADTLRHIHALLTDQKVRVIWVHATDSLEKELDRYGLTTLFGRDAFHETVRAVLAGYDERY